MAPQPREVGSHRQRPSLVFYVDAVAPFRLDLTAWALRRRPHNAVDRWDGTVYRRALMIDERVVEVAAEQIRSAPRPRLRVTVTGAGAAPALTPAIRAVLERALGLHASLSVFYRFARADARLAPLVAQFRGLKPPRFPTVFEALLNGIACQQLSLLVGIELLNRLARRFGATVPDAGEAAHAFPGPAALAAARHDSLMRLGLSSHKTRAILGLARAVASGRLDLESLADLEDDAVVARLEDLDGVGRWTAEYVLLRGLGRLHVFPGDDVGARNTLQRWLGRRGQLDSAGVRRALADWGDWGGLIYFHLLLKGLAEKGELSLAAPAGEAATMTEVQG